MNTYPETSTSTRSRLLLAALRLEDARIATGIRGSSQSSYANYIYSPVANSNGAILEMLDEKNPVVYTGGGRRYKLFQYLSEVVGLPALRAQIWQVIGIGNAMKSKEGFERGFRLAFPQAHEGAQSDLFGEQSLEPADSMPLAAGEPVAAG
jgi:hypothetical protein